MSEKGGGHLGAEAVKAAGGGVGIKRRGRPPPVRIVPSLRKVISHHYIEPQLREPHRHLCACVRECVRASARFTGGQGLPRLKLGYTNGQTVAESFDLIQGTA